MLRGLDVEKQQKLRENMGESVRCLAWAMPLIPGPCFLWDHLETPLFWSIRTMSRYLERLWPSNVMVTLTIIDLLYPMNGNTTSHPDVTFIPGLTLSGWCHIGPCKQLLHSSVYKVHIYCVLHVAIYKWSLDILNTSEDPWSYKRLIFYKDHAREPEWSSQVWRVKSQERWKAEIQEFYKCKWMRRIGRGGMSTVDLYIKKKKTEKYTWVLKTETHPYVEHAE